MIDLVDTALARLVERELGDGVRLAFDAPASLKDTGTKTLLGAHLYEVREETEMRTAGVTLTPGDGENAAAPATRRPAPRWYRLAYWLSAWGGQAPTQHALLAAALGAIARNPVLPADLLEGDLERLGLPVALTIASPAASDPQVAALWTSLGVPMRAGLQLAVVAPLDVGPAHPAGPPVAERRMRMRFRPEGGGGEELLVAADEAVPPRVVS